MKDYVKQELERRIAAFQQLPYLFVGTGFSKRYSHAPSWDQLLWEVWHCLYPDKGERGYRKLIQKIERKIEKSNPETTEEERTFYVNPLLATELEREFNNRYYEEDEFEKLLFDEEDNNIIIEKNFTPFKYFVAKRMRHLQIDKDLDTYKELDSLIQYQNKIAGIITTNYDELLEAVFHDFSVLVGQDSLLLASSLNIFEIFKIHGSCTDPESIILTQEDYNKFLRRLKYLSAKLLTIFVEHPIIFVGYGLGDVNIRSILQEIAECLNPTQLEKIKDNFIFISPAFGKEESFNKNTLSWGNHSIVINEFVLEDYREVYESLSKIKSSLPIKLTRKLQDMVCNFVYSTEVQNNILFGDVNSPDIDEDKVAVYFSKADTISQIGFSYFSIDDVLEDVLFDNKPFLISNQLIEKTFKNIRSSAGSTLLPIYKYVKKLDYDMERIPSNYNIIKGYDDSSILPTSSDRKNYIKSGRKFTSIKDIEEAFPNHIPKQVANIKESAKEIETEELGTYLRKYYNTETFDKNKSLFRKLIALYDFKRYKK